MIENGARVGVVGAGAMGTEIAFCFALAGFEVLVQDNDGKKLEDLISRSAAIYDKGVGRGIYEAEHRAAVLSSIACSEDIGSLQGSKMVTEAVFENEDVKAAVLRRLDEICDAQCVIATNTSQFRFPCFPRTSPRSDVLASSAPTIFRRHRA